MIANFFSYIFVCLARILTVTPSREEAQVSFPEHDCCWPCQVLTVMGQAVAIEFSTQDITLRPIIEGGGNPI
jgi:hypothetical protein